MYFSFKGGKFRDYKVRKIMLCVNVFKTVIITSHYRSISKYF